MDIGYDRRETMHCFQDESLTIEIPMEQISDEVLAEIMGGVILVRCKDCKKWEDGWCYEIEQITLHDFYCGYGERKDEKTG